VAPAPFIRHWSGLRGYQQGKRGFFWLLFQEIEKLFFLISIRP
jgi:hypothetical protein